MKCWMCGKEISHSDSNARQYCKECEDKHNAELKHDKELYAILKKKVMFERAMELMEKQGCKMGKYRNATIVVQKYLYANPDKFDSADEIVAAIVLIKNGLQIKTQIKIGKYQVDILIPSLNVVLEIDGVMHKLRLCESERDRYIESELGPDWDVLRIGTHHIETKADNLVKAITALKEYKRTQKTG